VALCGHAAAVAQCPFLAAKADVAEAMFRLRIFFAREFEKCRRWNQAAVALVEVPAFRPEIKDRTTAT
jgi:hypothetical protein